jgi:hypothetical protein
MTSTPAPSVQHVPHEFQPLLTSVTGPDARTQTASTVEVAVFRRRLALGAALWRLCLVTRAAVRPAEPVTAPDGTPLPSHAQRPTTYDAVFGTVCFARPCYPAPGQQGRCPLDVELSWPARGDADRRREWAVDGPTDESCRERPPVLHRILGLWRRVQALEPWAAEAGTDVSPFYEQPAEPLVPAPLGTILVVHADGTGVPRGQPPTPRPPVRLGQGQQRGTKQEAVVTGLYPVGPYPRPPQEGVAAL